VAPLEPTEVIVSITPLLSEPLKNATGFETCVATGTVAALVQALLEEQSQ